MSSQTPTLLAKGYLGGSNPLSSDCFWQLGFGKTLRLKGRQTRGRQGGMEPASQLQLKSRRAEGGGAGHRQHRIPAREGGGGTSTSRWSGQPVSLGHELSTAGTIRSPGSNG